MRSFKFLRQFVEEVSEELLLLYYKLHYVHLLNHRDDFFSLIFEHHLLNRTVILKL